MNIKNKLKNSLLPYIILLLIIFSLFFYFALSNFNMAQRKEDYIANLNFMFTAAENSQTPVYLLYKDKKIELTPLEIKRIKFYISQVKDIVNKRNMKE
ncbi:MAG: hypothetical protein GYA87_09530 [Christensenellaceae bacterium]|nr:hypothetical protein [Christensenellaceae bacterium]